MDFNKEQRVARRSLSEIDGEALTVRQRLSGDPNACLDFRALFEVNSVEIVPMDDDEMGTAKALARSSKGRGRVFVRSSLEQSADHNNPIAIGDLMHELGHVVLHIGDGLKPLLVSGQAEESHIPADENSEDQAWVFSRAVRMPRSAMYWRKTDREIASLVNVTVQDVRTRRGEISEIEASESPRPSVRPLMEQFRSGLSGTADSSSFEDTEEYRLRLQLWQALPKIPGQDQRKFRDCDGYGIDWHQYNKRFPPHQGAWFVRSGRIYSAMKQGDHGDP